MASSYDSVQRQAQKGNVARSTIDQWIVDGLNSANVQIQSNDNEERCRRNTRIKTVKRSH